MRGDVIRFAREDALGGFDLDDLRFTVGGGQDDLRDAGPAQRVDPCGPRDVDLPA